MMFMGAFSHEHHFYVRQAKRSVMSRICGKFLIRANFGS